jgi:hypothetical protein
MAVGGAMRVQLKKVAHGRPSLACVRADGTRTWSSVHPFFPLHDLMHYAVESVFGFREAFFGLIVSGWEIDAFATPGTAARLPPEALLAECIVGLFDLERGTRLPLSSVAFSEALRLSLAGQDAPAFRTVDDTELGRVRTLHGEMAARWAALEPGHTLDLPFPAANDSAQEE